MYVAPSVITAFPCTSFGKAGTAGIVHQVAEIFISSGASAAKRRIPPMTRDVLASG